MSTTDRSKRERVAAATRRNGQGRRRSRGRTYPDLRQGPGAPRRDASSEQRLPARATTGAPIALRLFDVPLRLRGDDAPLLHGLHTLYGALAAPGGQGGEQSGDGDHVGDDALASDVTVDGGGAVAGDGAAHAAQREVAREGERWVARESQREAAREGQREEAREGQREVARGIQREVAREGQREVARELGRVVARELGRTVAHVAPLSVALRAPQAGDAGQLELRHGPHRRALPLPGDAPSRLHGAHLTIAQAAAALAPGIVLHGASLRRGGAYVLLLGPMGAGKSTLAMALAVRGWSLLADDFSWLDHGGTWRDPGLPALVDAKAAALAAGSWRAGGPTLRASDGRRLRPLWPLGRLGPLRPLPAPSRPEAQGAQAETSLLIVMLPAAPDDGAGHPSTIAKATHGVPPPQVPLPARTALLARVSLKEVLAELARQDVGMSGRRFLHGARAPEALAAAARLQRVLGAQHAKVVRLARADPTAMARAVETAVAARGAHGGPSAADARHAELGAERAERMRPAVGRAALALWRHGGGIARITVSGGSMRPLLQPGDRVRLRAAPGRPGDVVVARGRGGVLVVHRLLARRAGCVVLRGDDTAAADPPRPATDVLGRVVAVEGARARRLDGSAARCVGRLAAAWGRHMPGAGRGRRPRAVLRATLAWEERLLGRPSPEERFVLLAARLSRDEDALAEARRLARAGLRTRHVLECARAGQLGPLVHRGARAVDGAGAPVLDDHLRAGLQALYAVGWARSRRVMAQLELLARRLAERGIPVLAHKGAALMLTVYPDPAMRLAGDLDLSVKDSDRRAAERAVADLRHALRMRHPDRRDPDALRVELDGTSHHDVDPTLHGAGRWAAAPLAWTAIWGRARPCPVPQPEGYRGVPTASAPAREAGAPGGDRAPDRWPAEGQAPRPDGRAPGDHGRVAIGMPTVLVPEPTDLLLTLVVNALRRGCHPPRLLADIAATVHVHGDAIDWTRLHHQLRAAHLTSRSWWPLGLAADGFGAAVPPALCEPPLRLRPAPWERWLLMQRARRPFTRLPTSLLWAGGTGRALVVGAHLASGWLRQHVSP